MTWNFEKVLACSSSSSCSECFRVFVLWQKEVGICSKELRDSGVLSSRIRFE